MNFVAPPSQNILGVSLNSWVVMWQQKAINVHAAVICLKRLHDGIRMNFPIAMRSADYAGAPTNEPPTGPVLGQPAPAAMKHPPH